MRRAGSIIMEQGTNPMLAMFNQEDPLRDMYPNISSHAYTANNPIKYIDPDGRYIDITESMGSDGKKTVNITFTGTLINNSSKNLSDRQLKNYANRISNAIKDYYGGTKEDGTIVNVNTDITIGASSDESRHSIFIMDPSPSKDGGDNIERGGASIPGGKSFDVSTSVLEYKPESIDKKWVGTGMDRLGRGTLERTSAHEFGHLGGLPDILTPDKNLMIQSARENRGTTITNSQIQQIKTNYETGKINKGLTR